MKNNNKKCPLGILYHHRTQGKGVERVHILNIINALERAGNSVGVLSPPGVDLHSEPVTDNPHKPKKNRWSGVTRYAPEFMFELLELLYNLWAIVRLRKSLREKSYHILYERYHFLGFAGLMIAKIVNVKFFIEMNYTCDSPLVRKRTSIIKSIDRLIENFLLKNADAILVVSEFLRRQLLKRGVEERRLILMPNAADPNKFDPNTKNTELRKKLRLGTGKVVGFVGFFYPWHGIDMLLDALPLIRQEVADVTYLLIGDGPTFAKVRERLKAENNDRRVFLTGLVSHDEIPKYISIFDVAVMPDSNSYGSPMKILEYMAMAKPTVAPRLGPIEDIIVHNDNGLLFEPKHTRQFAEMVIHLLKNNSERMRIAQNARECVCQKHNWDANARLILDAFYNGS